MNTTDNKSPPSAMALKEAATADAQTESHGTP